MDTKPNTLTRLAPAAVATLFLFCARVSAGPVLNDPEEWDSGLAGWTNTTGDGALSTPGGEFLKITFGPQVGLPSYEEDTIYTAEADETGNFQNSNLVLRFSFYAEDLLPLSSVLYLHPAGGPDTDYWAYEFSNTEIGEWTWHDIRFVYSEDWAWSAGAGSAEQFWNDLTNITWIGVNIARDDTDTREQVYGLDHWQYYVPEPGSVCMLASALLSLAFTFRKRLKQFVTADGGKA